MIEIDLWKEIIQSNILACFECVIPIRNVSFSVVKCVELEHQKYEDRVHVTVVYSEFPGEIVARNRSF